MNEAFACGWLLVFIGLFQMLLAWGELRCGRPEAAVRIVSGLGQAYLLFGIITVLFVIVFHAGQFYGRWAN